MEPIEILLTALNSPCGLVLLTDNVEPLKNDLYKAKKDHHESAPLLSTLVIRTSPDSSMEVWVTRDAEKVLAEANSLQSPDHPQEIDLRGDRHSLPSPEVQPEPSDPDDLGTIFEEE